MSERVLNELVDEELARWTSLLIDRFGLASDVFDAWRFFYSNRKLICVIRRGCHVPDHPPVIAAGLPCIHVNMAFPKLTTGAARVFGHTATRNVIKLDAAQTTTYLRRENQALSPEQLADTSKGYVLLRHEEVWLGVGLLRPQEDGSGWLESLYPKAHALASHRGAFEEDR
jgi:hypothetical protein